MNEPSNRLDVVSSHEAQIAPSARRAALGEVLRLPYFIVGLSLVAIGHVILKLGPSGRIGTPLFIWAYSQLALANALVPTDSWRWAPSVVWTIGYTCIAAILSVIGEQQSDKRRGTWTRAAIGWVAAEGVLGGLAYVLYHFWIITME